MSKSYRLAACLLAAALFLCACAAPESAQEAGPSAGSILLCGEAHSYQPHQDRELELWQECYDKGMRHFILEYPYYEAEFLNQWMAAEDDAILDHFFEAIEGTQGSKPCTREFFRQIKRRFPETVFHGMDVGHQYETLGAEYLAALEAQGLEDSEDYRLALQTVEQGKKFYELLGGGLIDESVAYREEQMYENFVRTFDALGGENIMGVFGEAHTGRTWNNGDSLGQKLRARYGDQVTIENLLLLSPGDPMEEPQETTELEINGKTYPAVYYGEYDLSAQLPAYKSRAFWRLEGAYEDLSAWTATGNVLPYSNYPMALQEGEAYAIHYLLADGSEQWEYHICNGRLWNGQPVTEEVAP